MSQEFDSEVLDLHYKKDFIPKNLCDFENFKEKLPTKNRVYSS